MNSQAKIFFGIIGLLVLGVITTVLLRPSTSAPIGAGEHDAFTQCLADKGAVFYGAFWCSHCASQKKLFGSSARLLPYIECSTADGNAQTQICIDKKIETYPTWEFADGTRLTGETPLATLAEKTSCPLLSVSVPVSADTDTASAPPRNNDK